MGCEDCPKLQHNRATLYVVYTGGPAWAPFAAMKTAIPDDGIIRRYQPTIHPDGRIEYGRNVPPPPVPEGYQTDHNDPWLLRPIWVSCVYRMYRVQMLDDGILTIEGQCPLLASSRPRNDKLTNTFCRACAVGYPIGARPTGTVSESPHPAGLPGMSSA